MTRTRAVLVAGMIAVAGIASASSQQGQPFDRLWSAILDLSARITTLENAPPPSSAGGAPVVVDVNGVVIGEVVDTTTTNTSAPGGATVILTRGGVLFPISVRKTGFRGPGPLFFTSTDCTPYAGGVYIRDHDGVFPNLYVWSPGNTVYVQDRTVLPSNVTVHSSSGFPGVCTQSTITIPLYPAWPVADLATEFTPPYRVQMGQ